MTPITASELLNLLNTYSLEDIVTGKHLNSTAKTVTKPSVPVASVTVLTPAQKAARTRNAARIAAEAVIKQNSYVRLTATDRGLYIPGTLLGHGATSNYKVVGSKGIHIVDVVRTSDKGITVPSNVFEKFDTKTFDVRVESNKIVLKIVV